MPRIRWLCRSLTSIASDLVAAFRPHFVSAATTAGTAAIPCSTRLVVIWTVWPLPSFSISEVAQLRDVKKPVTLSPQDRRVVGLGVLSERFGDKDAGFGDERVDAPEPGDTFVDRPLGRLPIDESPETATISASVDGSIELAVATIR
jgi:hypothetical protein